MAEETLSKTVKMRKELEQHHDELTEVSEQLLAATREIDPEKLTISEVKMLHQQLDELKIKIKDAVVILSRNETDRTLLDDDKQRRIRMLKEWDRQKLSLMNMTTYYLAEKEGINLQRTIRGVERMTSDHPTKNHSASMTILPSLLQLYRGRLDDTNIKEDHFLWTAFDEYQDRIGVLMQTDSLPTDAKGTGMLPDTLYKRGSYKIAALAVPKFDGNILHWVTFWQEFDQAVNSRADLDNSIKMVYLKQAITEPGLQTTISDLGIETGSYGVAVSLLKKRYNQPRVMHRLICEELRDINQNISTKNGLTEMADKAQHILLSLTRLKTMGASEIITSLVESAMGSELREHWLTYTNSLHDTPAADKIIEFLRMKSDRAAGNAASFLKTAFSKPSSVNPFKRQNQKGVAAASPSAGNSTNNQKAPANEFVCKYSCPLCRENHYCFHCTQFKNLTVTQKKQHAATHSLCTNCLKPGHAVEACYSTYRCSSCSQKHSSLLHEEPNSGSSAPLVSASTTQTDGLLMTANVIVTGSNGKNRTVRAFIDSGSSVSLISNKLKTELALKATGCSMSIDGVGEFRGETPYPVVSLNLSSPQDRNWDRNITAVALPTVVRELPLKDATKIKDLPHLQGLVLADPSYYKIGPIDMLLGMELFDHIFLTGRKKGPPNTPSAWDSVFGWVVLGTYNLTDCKKAISAVTLVTEAVDSQVCSDKLLVRFWKSEEPPEVDAPFTSEEQRVEEHYKQTHKYDEVEKRYSVTLPKTIGGLVLGESRSRALHRAQSTERSLIRKNKWAGFQKVMEEYITLGHAVAVEEDKNILSESEQYFMPVHSVVKESSTTTKIRAVFDASAPTANGVSLNDLLAVGPVLQPSLDQTLIRFRMYNVAISGDISKMYREILLSPADRPLHRFLWRKDLAAPWKAYEMNRVTFGVTSSPYVAIKTLMQTATDFGNDCPVAQQHIRQSFYVDDFFGGAESEEEACVLREDLNSILSQGGFSLKKWRSSSKKVLESIPEEMVEEIPDRKTLDSHSSCYPKALGLVWDSKLDEMATDVDIAKDYSLTKRGVVQDIARTFDVLGWLAPVILKMKLLYRTLWMKKIDWDQPVPADLAEEHIEWRIALASLSSIRLTRHYFKDRQPALIELHGFSDASTQAFAAVIYVRAEYQDGPPTSTLVVSKTRVAPLKERTIPELELCGAQLLAKLLKTTSVTLNIKEENIYAYSDSTIVLAWLDGSPKRYRLYVSNRIFKTNSMLSPEAWHYVPTGLNPADCASRGISASELVDHPLWWQGPPWLLAEPLILPAVPGKTRFDEKMDIEHLRKTAPLVAAVLPPLEPIIEHCANSWYRMTRIFCWITRFLDRIKKKIVPDSKNLSVSEIELADTRLKLRSQQRSYGKELSLVQTGKPLETKQSLLALNPKLNSEGLLVVGGRLQNADITETAKHPVILSAKDVYTKLLMGHFHKELMHGGPTAILAHSGTMFHIEGARRLARNICQSCITCKKAAGKINPQLMGQLPSARVEPARAFLTTGLDYAGPFFLKEGYVRRPVEIKCWLAVFVCFSSKAVHLELVKDATTASLVACLSRFCSRRGRPKTIWSDNGSTMIGAKNELNELYKELEKASTQTEINDFLLQQKIEWKLTPVKAPHFGGLWEAAVKAAKFHLKRVVGQCMFTYDELDTIVCQAEACLNSRPLGVLTSHPIDGQVPLTPGHFLIGCPITSYPTKPVECNPTFSQKWQYCSKLTEKFWHRWSTEYLQQLQRANKWHSKSRNFAVGDYVLLRDHSTYQCQWLHAMIHQIYPGRDGVVRAVDLRLETVTKPDKWINKTDFLQKLKKKTTICRRPVDQLTLLLPEGTVLGDESSGTGVPAPPNMF